MRNEILFLAYHLHWSHSEIAGLPTSERWAYVRLLSEQLQREEDVLERVRRR